MQFGMGSHVEGIDNGITLSTVKSRDGVIGIVGNFKSETTASDWADHSMDIVGIKAIE